MRQLREKEDRSAYTARMTNASTRMPRLTAALARRALPAEADPVRAVNVARFFKCGPGEYGEGDTFMGVTVPAIRRIARRFRDLPLPEVDRLLKALMAPFDERPGEDDLAAFPPDWAQQIEISCSS